MCAKLGGVETLDLAEALDEFSQACVKFDCAKGEGAPSSFIPYLRTSVADPVGAGSSFFAGSGAGSSHFSLDPDPGSVSELV